MNKRINFEDTIFILNVRIRMIRDLIHLDTDKSLFYSQTIGDLEFISFILNILAGKFLENQKFLDYETEADNILDAEWQFCQLLNEISNNTSPFSSALFPEMPSLVDKLRKESANRKIKIEESYVPSVNSIPEPVVSHAELNGLLGSA